MLLHYPLIKQYVAHPFSSDYLKPTLEMWGACINLGLISKQTFLDVSPPWASAVKRWVNTFKMYFANTNKCTWRHSQLCVTLSLC